MSLLSTTSVSTLIHHYALPVSSPNRSVKHLHLTPLESPLKLVVQMVTFSSLNSDFPLIFILLLFGIVCWILLTMSHQTNNIQAEPSSLILLQSSFMPVIKLEPPQPKPCCQNTNSNPSARSIVSLSRNTWLITNPIEVMIGKPTVPISGNLLSTLELELNIKTLLNNINKVSSVWTEK